MFVVRHISHGDETWLSRLAGRKLRNPAPDALSPSDGTGTIGDNFPAHAGGWCENGPDATLVTSQMDRSGWDWVGTNGKEPAKSYHLPVLDLDVEHLYYPSTTPGHGALLLNVILTDVDHSRLLDLLEELGIIQPGFVEASRQRGYAALRTPWTDKVQPPAPEHPTPSSHSPAPLAAADVPEPTNGAKA